MKYGDLFQPNPREKTPEQKAQLKAHLAKFAAWYGNMTGQMVEFVDAFPFHPNYAALIEKISFAEKPDLQRIQSDTLQKLADEPLPEDHPGLIAYDSYWEHLRHSPACQAQHEIEAVIHCARDLETKIEKAHLHPEYKEMARRIVHALAIHRLTATDIYEDFGPTPAELRDTLCLHHHILSTPDETPPETPPSDLLLAEVITVLQEIRKIDGGQLISSNPDTRQHYLRIRKFKRFVMPEVVLHWVNAVPFLLLMATGGAMLASRFVHIDRKVFSVVLFLHQLSATIWLYFLPPTILLRFKTHWGHIREVLKWGVEDIFWMVQSARSLYYKKALVPAAGRFNTGQKINACLVIVYFFGFGTTGLLMFFKGTILFPWYIHTALFFSALGSVGGHMYLALLNPSTRIALAGIFHGWAPLEYVEHHHPLSLPASRRAHIQPVTAKTVLEEILISRVELVIVAITVMMGIAGFFVFQHARLAAVKKNFAKSFADCIQPNRLSTKHQIGPITDSCTKCHLYAGQIPNVKCEKCHTDIKERRANRVGFHGKMKGDCRNCHWEHQEASQSIIPMSREEFDHNLADFKRDGKHAKLECDECHKKKRTTDTPGIYYIGLKYKACTDCHRDQHAGQFAADCTNCHSPAGWTGKELKFVHDKDSSFPLVGKHKTTECIKCHKPPVPGGALGTAIFKGLPKNCTGCHEEPHRKQFAAACTTCHSPASWKREALSFDHNKNTKFPLLLKHAEVACNKCHTPSAPGESLGFATFRALKTECADCHKDPHRGQFEQACTKCHTAPTSWKQADLRFEHNRDTKFTLAGKHTSVDCIKCHKPVTPGGALSSATFKGLGTSCESCHKVQHPQAYGTSCLSCHTVNGWPKKMTVDHILKYKSSGQHLLGKHLTVKCSECHNPSRIAAVGRPGDATLECNACHKNDEPHKAVLGMNCSKCHNTAGWKGDDLLFDHNTMASFVLTQDHKKVSCVKCHENKRWKPLDSTCQSCHPKLYGESKK